MIPTARHNHCPRNDPALASHRRSEHSRQFLTVANCWADLTLVLAICLSVGCSTIERACLYQPLAYPGGNWQAPPGLLVEDAWFQAADGTKLHGWFAPCAAPKAVILFAHGRAGNVTTPAQQLGEFCLRHQVAVMIFDYRGFGRSEGIPSEEGLYQDARAARDWLAKRSGTAPSEIVLMGRSLGAAVVVELAANDGAKGLILECAFASLPKLIQHHARGLPADWLVSSKFDSLSKIERYAGPLLISHGSKDCLIPFEHAELLFDAANRPKQLVPIPAAGHQTPPSDEYHRILDEFLGN